MQDSVVKNKKNKKYIYFSYHKIVLIIITQLSVKGRWLPSKQRNILLLKQFFKLFWFFFKM